MWTVVNPKPPNIRHNIPGRKSKDEIKMNRFRKNRNQAMNNIFDKYNLPRNMANNQIKRRVKYHNWVRSQGYWVRTNGNVLGKWSKEYVEFLMDRTVFNEKKRKDMVKLALEYGNNRNILSLRSPVIIAYLWEMYYLSNKFVSTDQRRFMRKELKVFGKFREDKAFETVLKKRIAFLRKLKRGGIGGVYVPMNIVSNIAHGNELKNFLQNAIQRRLSFVPSHFLTFVIEVREGERNLASTTVRIENILRFMKEFYPIPPHTNSTKRRAATTIQKTVRGMLNRKKVKARTASAEKKKTLKRKRKRSIIERDYFSW